MAEKTTLQTPTKIPTPDSGKIGTPDRLKVPEAFKIFERYTSPTDQMVSPITRRILARSKRGSKLLPPSTADQPKIQGLQLQEQRIVEADNTC